MQSVTLLDMNFNKTKESSRTIPMVKPSMQLRGSNFSKPFENFHIPVLSMSNYATSQDDE